MNRYNFGTRDIYCHENGDWVMYDDVKQAYNRMVQLEKVAMFAQELLHPKGSEPMCLTEQAKNEQARRERLRQALSELNSEWGK
jgi:actin-related protein